MRSRPAAPGVALPAPAVAPAASPPAAFRRLVQAETVRRRTMIEVAKVTDE
jgi:hypothetical protein